MANGAVDELIHDQAMDLLAQRITLALRLRENTKTQVREAKAEVQRLKARADAAELELAAWSQLADDAGIRVQVEANGTVEVYGR